MKKAASLAAPFGELAPWTEWLRSAQQPLERRRRKAPQMLSVFDSLEIDGYAHSMRCRQHDRVYCWNPNCILANRPGLVRSS